MERTSIDRNFDSNTSTCSSGRSGGRDDVRKDASSVFLGSHDDERSGYEPFVTGTPRSQHHDQQFDDNSSSSRSSRRRSNERVFGIDEESVIRHGSVRVRATAGTSSSSSSSSSVRAAATAAPLEPSLCAMSVVLEGPNIAFCCYNEEKNEITVENCTATGYETEALVERFLQVTRPNMVLVGNRIVNNAPLLQMVTRTPPHLPANEEEEEEGEEDDVVTGDVDESRGPSTNKSVSSARINVAGGEESSTLFSSSSIPYRLLKSGTFDVRLCKTIIVQKLHVLSMLKQEARQNQHHHDSSRNFPLNSSVSNGGIAMFRPSSFHYLAAVIDFDSKVLVQALGALLSYLQSTVFQLEEGSNIIINKIINAKTSAYMTISPSTFSALHIFSTEHHPLIAKGQGNSKEGFSLYSLLDRTKSRGGRQLLREWMLKPLINLEAIRTRHDATEFFLHPTMQTSVGVLLSLLKNVGPIDKILLRIQKCTTKPNDFLILTTTLSAAISISNVLRNDILSFMDAQQPDSSKKLCSQYFSELHSQCNVEDLIDLRERITAIVDVELTIENKKATLVIRHGFHEELDLWKEQYEYLEDTLAELANHLFQKHNQLDGLSVVFVPQIGYLVGLNKDLISHAQIKLPDDFVHQFQQDSEVFFKCDEVRNMDDEIGDLDGLIKDTERSIVTELEEDILETENELRECFKALSSLDCILSFADCASDLGFTRPRLIDDDDVVSVQSQSQQQQQQQQKRRQVIYIKDGRHPLQEIICEREFVTNDVQIDDLDRILCVTGSNYSGKSCYLRQVGLLVYMAHIGSFIPCSQAIISITDQIFARVSTIETCSRPQSSYQLELTEMASIILKATPKSLVLIDEFGKGTNPASGIAILGAALKQLSKIQCKSVCTTHFLELFTMNVIKDQDAGIRARRMAIHLPDGDDDSATPLFKLEDGVASSSAGLICAKNAGVSHTVIDRAKEIIQTMRARKFIRPLPEATKQIPKFSATERYMLAFFASVDSWESGTCSDEQVKHLLLLLEKVNPHE